MMPMPGSGGPGGPMAPGGPPSPMGGGMKPDASAGPAPEEVKGQLVLLLQKVKQMANANGINFDELVSQVKGGGSDKPPVPSPME